MHNPIAYLLCVSSVTPSVSPTILSTMAPSSYPSLSPSAVFIITTIAGTGASSYSGDNGAASSAALYNPCGVALDSSGIDITILLIMLAIFTYLFSLQATCTSVILIITVSGR